MSPTAGRGKSLVDVSAFTHSLLSYVKRGRLFISMANGCEDEALSADGARKNDRNQSGKAYSIGCIHTIG
jgi:hypothetical protein